MPLLLLLLLLCRRSAWIVIDDSAKRSFLHADKRSLIMQLGLGIPIRDMRLLDFNLLGSGAWVGWGGRWRAGLLTAAPCCSAALPAACQETQLICRCSATAAAHCHYPPPHTHATYLPTSHPPMSGVQRRGSCWCVTMQSFCP